MTRQTGKTGPRRPSALLVLSLAVGVLVLAATTFHAAQTLSRDDCATVTTAMPNGSRVTAKTCS